MRIRLRNQADSGASAVVIHSSQMRTVLAPPWSSRLRPRHDTQLARAIKRLFLIVLAATAGIMHRAEAGLTSVTINGLTVPMNVVSNYAPVVGLHYWEEYLPCSIDYILAHASIVQGQPSDYAAHLSDGTVVLIHPTQQQLYQIATNDPAGTNYYLSIESAARTGGPPAGTAPPYDSSVLTNVPMYVSIQVPPDASFADLN